MSKLDSYERWKKREKINKAPWVIRYYESITDINQYKLSKIVEKRLALGLGVACFVYGFIVCYFLSEVLL